MFICLSKFCRCRYITGKAFGKALKIGKGKTVCVTGASGFIASHCVQQLLATGYTVHGTVRSLENREKVAHLEALPFAATRLKLFEADLLVDGSFDAAVAGCDAVLHTASPLACCLDIAQVFRTAKGHLLPPKVCLEAGSSSGRNLNAWP